MPKGAISLTVTFLLVLAMIYFAYVFTRMLAEKSMGSSSGKYIGLMERFVLGKDVSVAILHIGVKYFLVGISESKVNVLAELKEEDLVEIQKTPGEVSGFLDSFKEELGKKIPKK